MKVHHLDCCTMCPYGGRLLNGDGRPWQTAKMVGHVLLVEAPSGLVLVDSGVGLLDCERPGRLGWPFVWGVRPRLDPAGTAARQVEALGFDRRDVRDIVLTHLDVDHAGGIADFPEARIHVLRAERDAYLSPSLRERERYRRAHAEHGPRWAAHEVSGEPWMGFPAVRELGLGPEILMVPMIGHTRGHCAVAVDTGSGWLVHAGDAYFHEREVVDGHCTPILSLFQNLMAMDRERMRANKARLRELRAGCPEVRLFSAHDPTELDRMRGA